MLSRIWTSLANIETEEQKYVRTVLNAILGVALIAIGVITVSSYTVADYNTFNVTALLFVLDAALLWLTWRDHVTLPRLIVPFVALIAAAYLAKNADGLRDEAMYALPLDLLLAGLLLGRRAVIVFTVLDLVAITLQAIGEINGSIVNHFSSFTTYETLIALDALLIFIGALLYVTIGNLRNSLNRARLNEIKFAKSNRELQAIQATLEDRVKARTAQLQASADVGRAVASILDREQLLSQIANLITERFGFYYAAVFLLDEDNRFAVLHEATGEAGRILKEQGHRLALNGTSMVSAAVTTRRLRIALDVGSERIRFANPLLPNTRSEIALPLVAGDRVFGALDVQSTEGAAFDESNANVLQSMADQIALALSNATSFTDVQITARRAKQTAALLGSTLELTMQNDRRALYERIVQLAVELANADGASLALSISETELELKAAIDSDPNPRQIVGRRLQAGEGVAGRVFTSKQSLRIDDYLAWNEHSADLNDEPYRAVLGIPLIWQTRVIGVLSITQSQPGRHFTEDDEYSAKLLASQAAASLINAELREGQEQTLKELNALNLRLTGEAWATFSRRLNRAGMDWIGSGEPMGPDQPPEVIEALSSGQTCARTGFDHEQTNVAVPIVLRGAPIGVVHLRVPLENWSADTAATLTAVAGHVAQAIENARLLQATEERFARERVLAESTDKIRRKSDVEHILQTAAEELAHHLQATRVAVRIQPQAELTSGDQGGNGSGDQHA